MRRATILALLFLAATSFVAAAGAEEPVPVIVAIDTSRSLSGGDLERIGARAGEALGALPAGTPVGLLAFDDAPRWVLEPGATAAEVAGRLRTLAPSGSVTLLHDALFTAATRLPDGGVVLLFTDGRDENSATTVEDIARRSEDQGVRILAVGVGRGVEERALRRLALVTDGAYLGRLADATPESIRRALGASREAVAAAQAERVAATTAASTAAAPAAGSSAPPPPALPAEIPDATRESPAPPWGWIAAGLLALVGASAVAFLLARRRPATPAVETCSRCGSDLPIRGGECPTCAEREIRALASRDVASPAEAREVTGDTVVFERMDPEEALEKTRVLTELSVLLVRERGEEQRAFVLSSTKAFGVGRTRNGNTLGLLDPALSSHHFKIVPDGNRFFFIDLESTNGSTVNGERVGARELRNGDVIRAGQVEFELKTRTGPLL